MPSPESQGADYLYGVSDEALFLLTEQEAASPEVINEAAAREALEYYVRENRFRGRAKWRRTKIPELHLQGYDDEGPTIQRILGQSYDDLQRAEDYRLQAQGLFADAISIPWERTIIEDRRGRYYDVIRAQKPEQNRELQYRYRIFRNLYGGPLTAKRRDKVRKGKADIIIPGYTAVDREFDRQLERQRQAIAKPQKKEPLKTIHFPETRLNEPGEPVLAVDLVYAYRFMVDSLTARGVFKSKHSYRGTKMEVAFTNVYKIPMGLTFPERRAGEKVGTYCRRVGLNADKVYALARKYYARATGYTLLLHSRMGPDQLVKSRKKVLEMFTEQWYREWRLRHGLDDKTRYLLEEEREWLEQAVVLFGKVEKAKQIAEHGLAAEAVRRRPLYKGRHPRPGQISLMDGS